VQSIGIPYSTMSDPGVENINIAAAEVLMRMEYESTNANDSRSSIIHRFCKSKFNQKPEVIWSQLRRRLCVAIEEKLMKGVNDDIYDASIDLHK